MKKFLVSTLTGALLCALPFSAALADLSLTGKVAASATVEIYAPIGGKVESISAEKGQFVHAGDILASLSTEKIYAPESGAVTGLFGEAGDSAEIISERYGAVLSIEGESVYTISASTDNAYNKTANKFVHVGESVYLSCYSDGAHTGSGKITAIEGTNYTVEVLSGEFLIGETVSVYRGEDNTAANRIGRGELTRKNPTAVTASGSIVSFAVADGDRVEKGDLLFETLSGSFDGLYMSGRHILASEDGVVAGLNLEKGAILEKGAVAAVLYPASAMRIETSIPESDLSAVREGDPVSIELIWNQDAEISYSGVVSRISAVANAAEGGEESVVSYAAYVDFTPDEDTRYGMSAVVTVPDAKTAEAQSDEGM